MYDDSDIKIFNAEPKDKEADNLLALAEEMKRHIINGNSAKAKQLGKKLADLSPDADNLGEELTALVKDSFVTVDMKIQLKTLMLFCAEFTLLSELCPMLSTTASEAMYAKLKSDFPTYYEGISNGAALSFYYLAVKKNKDISRAVGNTFAMLCSAENNTIAKTLGENAFILACNKIKEVISAFDFEK